MADGRARRFDRAFKVAALERMAAGANVSALSRELGVRRKLLYRDTVRRGGVEALRGVGRPRAGARLAASRARPRVAAPRGVVVADELALAGERMAALERKIGQQALELDFFGQALPLMDQAGRVASGPHDAPAWSLPSGPHSGTGGASSRRGRGGKAG